MSLIKVKGSSITGDLPAISGANLTGISGGKVLKVEQFDCSSDYNTTSATFSNYVTKSFTPTSASSTIFYFLTFVYQMYGNTSSNDASGAIKIVSEATGSQVTICQQGFVTVSHGNSNTHYEEMSGSCSGSEASQGTSAYNIKLAAATRGTGRMRVLGTDSNNTKPVMLTVMEVAS